MKFDNRTSEMTYYPDLTEYGYLTDQGNSHLRLKGVLNIGWLELEYDYPKGSVDELTLGKIRELLFSAKNNINQTRGTHLCDFCQTHYYISFGGEEIVLGMSELWVPSGSGIIYAAPTLIYHYIEQHAYQPPLEFLNAVRAFDFNSPWNGQTIFEDLWSAGRNTTP